MAKLSRFFMLSLAYFFFGICRRLSKMLYYAYQTCIDIMHVLIIFCSSCWLSINYLNADRWQKDLILNMPNRSFIPFCTFISLNLWQTFWRISVHTKKSHLFTRFLINFNQSQKKVSEPKNAPDYLCHQIKLILCLPPPTKIFFCFIQLMQFFDEVMYCRRRQIANCI